MELQVILDKIVQSKSIVIVPHHNPDGDAMGSALGLYNTLISFGKKDVSVIVPSAFPDFLSWMKGADMVLNFELNKNDVIHKIDCCDLLFMVDFNSSKRVKGMSEYIDSCKAFKIVIDHHPMPDNNVANIIISDIEVSSTCELMYVVLNKCGFKNYITVDAASCLYTGIMTDTGLLSHNSSRPETYHVVADLVEIGINKDQIHRDVFHSNSFNRMRLLGYSLFEKMKVFNDLKASYISLTSEELLRFEFKPGDTEGLVNYPLSIEGVDVSALFMEQNNRIKVSLRSHGNIAVNQLSEENFNGGGHFNAAGGESFYNMETTIEMYLKALPKFI
ncbi:MAG: bifunctional oligoribonuclease/PAP phosphatase NrnA [Marinilabiliaceae bacterium]|nr:bifunctional oligoribonuclease/PAP phosphatase NrnA [Marinilabiliaceae bacterium]